MQFLDSAALFLPQGPYDHSLVISFFSVHLLYSPPTNLLLLTWIPQYFLTWNLEEVNLISPAPLSLSSNARGLWLLWILAAIRSDSTCGPGNCALGWKILDQNKAHWLLSHQGGRNNVGMFKISFKVDGALLFLPQTHNDSMPKLKAMFFFLLSWCVNMYKILIKMEAHGKYFL